MSRGINDPAPQGDDGGKAMRRQMAAGFAIVVAGICAALVAVVGSASAAAPVVTMDSATNPTYTTVDVTGTLNPEGEAGEWFFQISSDGGGSWERTSVAGQFGEPVEGTITGLKAGATYEVRLAAYNYSEFVEVSSSDLEFTTESVPAPTVAIDPVTSHTGTTAELSGSITANSPAGNPAAADVHWHFECSPGCPGEPFGSLSGTVSAGSSEAVQVTATGVEPNTEYTVTLVGENAGGAVTAGPVDFTTSIVAPVAETLPANALAGGTGAKLRGSVDPNNSPTEYWFEYGRTKAYGQVAPAGHADAGAGRQHAVVHEIGDLIPDTTYHYQLVAEGPGGTSTGGDVEFTTAPAANQACPNEAIRRQQYTTRLPECRAYELVSPADKEGGRVGLIGPAHFNDLGGFRIGADGNAAVYPTSTALSGSTSSNLIYKATRSSAGWSSAQVSPPVPPGVGLYRSLTNVSADLSTGVFMDAGTIAAGEFTTGTENILLHGLEPGGSSTLLDPGQAPGFRGARMLAQSKELTHAVFASNSALTPGAPSGAFSNLYDYSGGALHLVSILPDGQPDPVGGVPGSPASFQENYTRFNAVSDDGNHISFTSLSDNQVYQRIDGTETVEVSASQGGADPTGAYPAKFVGATTTGSKVYFTSAAELTPDANTGGHSGADLYEYNVASGDLTDLTVDENPSDPAGANVLGLAGLADDGSNLFVVAEGALVAGARSGQPNLYAVHANGAIDFATTLAPGFGGIGDSPIWLGTTGLAGGSNAQAAPNGRYLAFVSEKKLTPDSVQGLNAYLYDADASTGPKLVCVSCGPGDAEGGTPQVSGYNELNLNFYVPRFAFDDGRMFFISSAPLVEEDTNGRYDVYEYRHGTLSLISSGHGNADSEFIDASPDGHDVLIRTVNRLLPADGDEAADLYDARVDGGFPESPAPPPCSGDGCRPMATAPPDATTPASSSHGGRASSTSRFTLGRISRQAVKAFGKTGRLTLHVETAGAGTIRATATARIGGRKGQIAKAVKRVAKASTASLVLRLSAPARRQLADSGHLKVALEVSFSNAPPSVRVLTLVAATHDRKGR